MFWDAESTTKGIHGWWWGGLAFWMLGVGAVLEEKWTEGSRYEIWIKAVSSMGLSVGRVASPAQTCLWQSGVPGSPEGQWGQDTGSDWWHMDIQWVTGLPVSPWNSILWHLRKDRNLSVNCYQMNALVFKCIHLVTKWMKHVNNAYQGVREFSWI